MNYQAEVVALDAGDMSADIAGPAIFVDKYDRGSFHYVWSGTAPVGVAKIQAANSESTPAAGDWVDLSGTGAISGNTGAGFLSLPAFDYKWLRAYFTFTSGVGTLTVRAKLRG